MEKRETLNPTPVHPIPSRAPSFPSHPASQPPQPTASNPFSLPPTLSRAPPNPPPHVVAPYCPLRVRTPSLHRILYSINTVRRQFYHRPPPVPLDVEHPQPPLDIEYPRPQPHPSRQQRHPASPSPSRSSSLVETTSRELIVASGAIELPLIRRSPST